MARGNYYANAHVDRDGKVYGEEVAWQARSFLAAARALNATGHRGYVQQWSDRTQQRAICAERDRDGVWTAVNPYTGERVALDPQPV